MTRKIITHFEFPPIPDRRFDYCAYRDDGMEGEPTRRVGWGRTEEEAVADLIDQEGDSE